jgi:predicted CoA-binding protein
MKKTVILGATTNPSRYAFMAAQLLEAHGHEFVPVGRKKGTLFGRPILMLSEKPAVDAVHTITVYMNSDNQRPWLDYILSLKPKRIIFNPGAENPELEARARQAGIEVVYGCTLVMLNTGQY